MKFRLTKSLRFVAAHQLTNPEWSEVRNREVYGKCSRMHGHDYVVEATVEGPVQDTGFVMNLTDLKAMMKRELVDPCDHFNLNDLKLFNGGRTTVENIARQFFFVLAHAIHTEHGDDGVSLASIAVYESPENRCEVTA